MNMTTKVLIGMLAGSAAGYFMGPQAAEYFSWMGEGFMKLIFMMIAPLVFLAATSGASKLKVGGGRMATKAFAFIFVTSVISTVVAYYLGHHFEVGQGVTATFPLPDGFDTRAAEPSVIATMLGFIPSNIFQSLSSNSVVQMLVFGLFMGFGIGALGQKAVKVNVLVDQATDVMMWMIDKILLLTPFGVFGIMAEMVGTFGFDTIIQMSNFVGVYLLSLAFISLVMYPAIVHFFTDATLSDYFKAIKEPWMFAITTCSSMATIPTTLKATRSLGVSQPTTGFVVPLGATLNMTGASAHYMLAAVFTAAVYGITLEPTTWMVMGLLCVFGAVGTAGVPGIAAYGLLIAVLEAGQIPVEALGLLIAIDRLVDMPRTAVNVNGDIVAALFADKGNNEK